MQEKISELSFSIYFLEMLGFDTYKIYFIYYHNFDSIF